MPCLFGEVYQTAQLLISFPWDPSEWSLRLQVSSVTSYTWPLGLGTILSSTHFPIFSYLSCWAVLCRTLPLHHFHQSLKTPSSPVLSFTLGFHPGQPFVLSTNPENKHIYKARPGVTPIPTVLSLSNLIQLCLGRCLAAVAEWLIGACQAACW